MRIAHRVNDERRFRADKKQRRAEKERKDMEKRLAKSIENRTWTDDVLASVEDTIEKAI